MTLIHASSDVFGEVFTQNFDPQLYSLNLHPYFVYASSEGSGDLKKKNASY